MKKIIILKIIFLFVFFLNIETTEASTPSISSFSPSDIIPGETTITINGSGFGSSKGNSNVYFGYYETGSVVSWSDSTIKVKPPSYLNSYGFDTDGELYVKVCASNSYSCQKSNERKYYFKPVISSISPTTAMVGDEVKISGEAFGDSYGRVTVDGMNAKITSWHSSYIYFTMPNTSSGKVVVRTASGKSSASKSMTVQGQPVIHSMTPQQIVPGETYITIKGNNFGDTFYEDTLYVTGESYSYLTGSSNTVKITRANWKDNEVGFYAPSNMKAGKVFLRVSTGYSTYTDFVESDYYFLQPAITSTSYASGAEGDSLEIYGTNLNNVFPTGTNYLQVYVGGVACGSGNITDWTSTKISINIPKGANSGAVTLEYTNSEHSKTIKVSSSDKIEVLKASANDQYSAYQQYIQDVNIDDAWAYSTGNKKVTVAVIDDGIYINHPELQNNIWQNTDEIVGNEIDDDKNGYVDDRLGWDFVSDEAEMTTRGTHGTMVAGIIGAVGNNGVGVTGINWNINLMSLIVCDSKGCDKEAISDAIKYAVDNGADIINLSLSTQMTIGYTTYLDEAIKHAYDNNVLVVAAAGNGDLEGGIGQNLDIIPQSPVCNDGGKNMVLGVASVDGDDYITDWTNYGKCVDTYAPGTSIISTAVPAYSTFEGFYDYANGTSFSAPIVSGIAALIKSKYPDISNEAIRDRIINYDNNDTIDAYKAISKSFTDSERVNLAKIEKQLITKIDKSLTRRLKGKILLQVESDGEGWYINPSDEKKYYLGRPADAFQIMRELGLGISENNYNAYNGKAPWNLSGKILLRVEANGEAYYVDPTDRKMHYLGKPEDAFQVMRNLGLGITNNDIRKIDVGEI